MYNRSSKWWLFASKFNMVLGGTGSGNQFSCLSAMYVQENIPMSEMLYQRLQMVGARLSLKLW